MIRSTFMGFEAAKSSVFANQKAIDIVGNNLANRETNGYTRQRVDRTAAYINSTANRVASSTIGQAGQGVDILGISQLRDSFLDKCFREEYSLASHYGQTANLQNDILDIFPEAVDVTDTSGVLGALEKIYESLNKYVQSPTLDSEANLVRSAFTNMTQVLQQIDRQLTESADRQAQDLRTTIDRTNDIISQITHLNKKISSDATVIANPNNEYFISNELTDQRNLLLDELASYGDINVISNSDGTVSVDFGGHRVINRTESDSLTMSISEKGYATVAWRSTGKSVNAKTGAIQAYVEVLNGRGNNVQSNDETSVQGVPYYRDRINLLASELTKIANSTIPVADATTGKPVTDGSGNIVYKVLLAAKDETGKTDSTLKVTAGNISISDEWSNEGPGYFIYSRDENVENYAQQLSYKIANYDTNFSSYGEEFKGTFSEYMIDLVGRIGSDVSFNEGRRDASATIADDYLSKRESVSGVQQDEETADLLQFQKSYAAAARVMTTMDDLLDILINRLGRVGL
ncbi:MAG: flagellar hook-associated protein FlgK [Clostridiales bacterium]|nr:flagellar hook-associated protein FlgK [Clostridiales bacterium]